MASHYDQSPALSDLTLGKTTTYIDRYDNTLLQAVPRSLNRQPLGLTPDNLPFYGADLWTLYELSWLNTRGLPQVAIGEISIPANSTHLIESKSFKLYLNSFNQTQFSDWPGVQQTLIRDLSACAQGEVSVTLRRLDDPQNNLIGFFSGDCIDDQPIAIDRYEFDDRLLEIAIDQQNPLIVEETLVSHLLKSNCLITHQPDWGSVQIHYRGPKINREALLRYLVSFRHHNEFHEQCVERIFTDIQRYCRPTSLTVYARYTRRGGLDINPYRTNMAFTPMRHRLARQ